MGLLFDEGSRGCNRCDRSEEPRFRILSSVGSKSARGPQLNPDRTTRHLPRLSPDNSSFPPKPQPAKLPPISAPNQRFRKSFQVSSLFRLKLSPHIPVAVASATRWGDFRSWFGDWIGKWGQCWQLGSGLTGLAIGVISSKPGIRTKWESGEPSCSSLHLLSSRDKLLGQLSALLVIFGNCFWCFTYPRLYISCSSFISSLVDPAPIVITLLRLSLLPWNLPWRISYSPSCILALHGGLCFSQKFGRTNRQKAAFGGCLQKPNSLDASTSFSSTSKLKAKSEY